MLETSIRPLTLHAGAGSQGPNPPKVAIALEMLSLPYTVRSWGHDNNDDSGITGSSYLAINPNGRTPTLQDPNTNITTWESSACLDYLARVYDPKGTILGPSPSWTYQQRTDYDTWTSLLISTMGPMTGQLYWFLKFVGTEDNNAQALTRYQEQVSRVLAVLEGQFKETRGWTVLSTGFSTVDIHWYCWVNASRMAGIDLTMYPMISKWHGSIKERDDVQTAYGRIATGEKVGNK
jgi:glutathione S-transferase